MHSCHLDDCCRLCIYSRSVCLIDHVIGNATYESTWPSCLEFACPPPCLRGFSAEILVSPHIPNKNLGGVIDDPELSVGVNVSVNGYLCSATGWPPVSGVPW